MALKQSYGSVSQFSKRYLWGNAGVGAKALSAAAYGVGDRDDEGLGSGVVRIDEPCDLVCHATVSGTACTSVLFQPQWSPIGENDFQAIPRAKDRLSSIQFETIPIEISPAAAGDYEFSVRVPGPCDFRLMSMRTGGAADSSLVVSASAVSTNGRKESIW